MQDFYILDTTLRDGEQTPGVVFLKDEKIEIAKKLDEAGVDIIEAGIPAMGEAEKDCMREIIGLKSDGVILAWNRMDKKDIEESLSCGAKHVHIAAPASDIHIYKKLRRDREWVLRQIQNVVSYAVEKGCTVSVGGEDASRADEAFIIELFQRAEKAGAVRLRYADTLGVLTPFSTYQRIKRIRENVGGMLDFHGHNDFGMATANTLSAFQAGATCFSCSINGLGERAGNTPMEEIVMALKILLKLNHPFDPKRIMILSEMVQKASKKVVGDGKPIVGKGICSHESGIHVDGLLKDSNIYEAFLPEEIGRQTEIILGKYSGSAAIIHYLQEMGIEVTKHQANEILKNIRRIYTYDKCLDMKKFLQQWMQSQKNVISSWAK